MKEPLLNICGCAQALVESMTAAGEAAAEGQVEAAERWPEISEEWWERLSPEGWGDATVTGAVAQSSG